jgi:hypothetical protein
MQRLSFILLLAACCVPGIAGAQTEIHKCLDAGGGVVYSQLPCRDQVPAEAESPEPAPPPETPEPAEDATPEPPDTDANTSACKKRYRDAIDAIDAEIRSEYSPEKDDEYKQRLLELTRKLREC